MSIGLQKEYSAYGYVAVTILLWAATPLLVSQLSLRIPVFQINWIVSAFSLPVLSVIIISTGRWRTLFSYNKKEITLMLFLGAVGIFPYTSLYYLAFALSPSDAGSINIINYSWPLWVIILSVPVLKEPLTGRKIFGILLSLVGVYLIISGKELFNLNHSQGRHFSFAILSASAGAFFWGLFSVLSKKNTFEPLTSLLMYNLASFLLFTIIRIFFVKPVVPSQEDWLLLIILGGIINVIGYLFWIIALRRGDTGRIANLIYLTPFTALVYLTVIRGTPINIHQYLGLALIVFGSLVQKKGGRKI